MPLGNDFALELARQHLVMHFKDYKEVIKGEKVVHLVLSDLREESASFFMALHDDGKLSGQVRDVYRSKVEKYDPMSELGKKDVYKLEKSLLRKVPDKNDEVLWEFIKATFLVVEGHATFVPVGWTFDERLLDSEFLYAMSKECEDIYLFVDPKNNEVRTILGTPVA